MSVEYLALTGIRTTGRSKSLFHLKDTLNLLELTNRSSVKKNMNRIQKKNI